MVVRRDATGAAIQCTSSCICSKDCHAAPQTEFATLFNDCDTMAVTLTFFVSFLLLFWTVFGDDYNDTYVLYYTHHIKHMFTKVN